MFFEAGIYKFNKPTGWTSFDVVNWVKHRTSEKRVGHAGTLDPAAEGLLLVAIGRNYTKILETISKADKEYVFEITFGITSDTYDRDGKLTTRVQDFELSESTFKNVLQAFLGQQQQLPPMYSAVKKDGKKLYQLARQGIEIEREPRDITIHELELLEFKGQSAVLRTVCSKGTYVRSLCHDLGQKLGLGAYMSRLTRTRIGYYTLGQDCLIPVSAGEKK